MIKLKISLSRICFSAYIPDEIPCFWPVACTSSNFLACLLFFFLFHFMCSLICWHNILPGTLQGPIQLLHFISTSSCPLGCRRLSAASPEHHQQQSPTITTSLHKAFPSRLPHSHLNESRFSVLENSHLTAFWKEFCSGLCFIIKLRLLNGSQHL